MLLKEHLWAIRWGNLKIFLMVIWVDFSSRVKLLRFFVAQALFLFIFYCRHRNSELSYKLSLMSCFFLIRKSNESLINWDFIEFNHFSWKCWKLFHWLELFLGWRSSYGRLYAENNFSSVFYFLSSCWCKQRTKTTWTSFFATLEVEKKMWPIDDRLNYTFESLFAIAVAINF